MPLPSLLKSNNLNFINCACKFTFDNEVNKESTSKRKEIKELINNLRKIYEAGEDKALLISATGTGKTYASARQFKHRN